MSAELPLRGVAEEARRRLVDLIASGSLRGGARLGAERDLAAELGISRSTLRRALGAMERDGAVRRVPGRGGGTFVSTKIDRDLSRIVGVPELLRSQGFRAGSRVLTAGVTMSDETTARALGLGPGALVYDVARIRLADGSPISLERARFPAEAFPDLLEQSLGGSIYELLEQRYATVPAEAEERIEVREAADEEAAILGVAPLAPLLAITRITMDAAGRPIEFSHDLFRADRTTVTVHTRGGAGAAVSLHAGGRLVELPRSG